MYTFEEVDSKIATFLTECGNSFASNDLLLRTKCADILPKCVLSKKYAFCSFPGASCGVVGLVIVMVTMGLAGRRYSQYRSSQTRLWELQ